MRIKRSVCLFIAIITLICLFDVKKSAAVHALDSSSDRITSFLGTDYDRSKPSDKDESALIWYMLYEEFQNDIVVAGIMGNLGLESVFIANNLEDYYSSRSGVTDAQYTEQVDAGTYSRNSFINDSYGYGLAQWTYWSIKRDMYDYIKDKGWSIGNAAAQTEFLIYSIKKDYPVMLANMLKADSVYEATVLFLTGYERPADQGTGVRNVRTSQGEYCYSKYSKSESKDFLDVYDFDYYLANYEDVGSAFSDYPSGAYNHFVDHGMSSGRVASAGFDVRGYRARYQDLQEEYGDDWTQYYIHYVNSGKAEGRIPYSYGWRKTDNTWYYYQYDGTMQTGWLETGSKWYYFNSDGAMQTGWQQIRGKWYCFNSKGAMQTGWLETGSKWYYLDSNGVMQTGWQQIGSKRYYFNGSGVMQTGWLQTDGVWYYLGSGGAMQTGWRQVGDYWYYFRNSGVMAAEEWVHGYWLNANGKWTYPYRASWKKNTNGWWYGDDSGWYARNTVIIIDGKSYSFDDRGYMI